MNEGHSDSDESSIDIYDYALVQFVHKGRKRKVEEIDVVPSKWLEFEKKLSGCVTPFLNSINSKEDSQLLHDLVKKLADPPDSWPKFSVDIKGRAQTYQEALQKVELLKYEEHCYSLESGDSVSEYKDKLVSSVRRKQLKNQSEQLQTILGKQDDDLNAHPLSASSSQDKGSPTPAVEQTEKLAGNQRRTTTTYQKKGTAVKKNQPTQPEVTDPSSVTASPTESEKNEQSPRASTSVDSPSPEQSLRASTPIRSPSLDKNVDSSKNFKQGIGIPSYLKRVSTSSTQGVNEKKSFAECNFNLTFPGEENQLLQVLNLPVINLSSVHCSTPFESAMLVQVIRLNDNVEIIKKDQEEMRNYLLDKRVTNIINANTDFGERYKINLPLETMQEFDDFNHLLENNAIFKNDFCDELIKLIDKNFSISKFFVSMLKRFLSKGLVEQFTALRPAKQKSLEKPKVIFKVTKFCKCMDVIITGVRSDKNFETEEKDLRDAISDVICNVRKWPA